MAVRGQGREVLDAELEEPSHLDAALQFTSEHFVAHVFSEVKWELPQSWWWAPWDMERCPGNECIM